MPGGGLQCKLGALCAVATGSVSHTNRCNPGREVHRKTIHLAQKCRVIPRRMKAISVRTYSPKPGDVEPKWYIIDASGVVLGRLASQIATLLRGKHKPTFAPNHDGGDFVVVINAEKVVLTGNKLQDKMAYHHSGFPGGLRAIPYGELLEKHPERVIEKAVKGMLPHTRLGAAQLSKLKVYAGPEHPHAGQKPEPFEITQIAQ